MISARSFRLSDEEMLKSLRQLYQQKGLLSGMVIDECDGMPSSSAYGSRFGSLLRAYSLVGFTPDRDYRYVEINRELRKLHPGILSELLDGLRATGSDAWQDVQTDRVIVNGEFSLSVVVARCIELPTGLRRWNLRFDNLARTRHHHRRADGQRQSRPARLLPVPADRHALRKVAACRR